MSLKIEDIKPGDIFLYDYDDNKWYFMVIRGSKGLDCVWVAENCRPERCAESSWMLFPSSYDDSLKLPRILERAKKVTNLAAEILIEELKKIDNRTS